MTGTPSAIAAPHSGPPGPKPPTLGNFRPKVSAAALAHHPSTTVPVEEPTASAKPSTAPNSPASAVRSAELVVRGLSSRSAGRLERQLNRLPSVFAIVSHATDRATISYNSTKVSIAEVMHVIQGAGFAVETGEATHRVSVATIESQVDTLGRPVAPDSEIVELNELRNRAIAASLLAVPVLALSLNPSWQAHG